MKFERKIGDTLIDIAMKVEDVRQSKITQKCYDIAMNQKDIQELMINQKGVKQSHFIHSVLFLLSEYLNEVNLSDYQKYQFCKYLVESEDLNKKAIESLRLQILNIIFKAALKNQDTSLDYTQLFTLMKPSGFDSFELKDQT